MASTQVDFHKNVDRVNVSGVSTGQYLKWDGSDWINVTLPGDDRVAVFTVAGTLEEGERNTRFYYPFSSGSLQVSRIRAIVDTAPVGSALTVELRLYNSSGSSAVGTATVSAGNNTGSNASLSNDYLVPGYWWQIAITGIGSSTPGSDLMFQVMCQPTGI